MMKRKIGTLIEGRIVDRAKKYSLRNHTPLNQVIEDALEAYLDSDIEQQTISVDEALRTRPGTYAEQASGEGAGDLQNEDFD